MRVCPFPHVAELCDGSPLARWHEDRVVPEALASARLVPDAALEHAGAPMLLPVGRERDQLAHVPRSALRDAVQLGEQPPDRIVAAEPPRVDTGAPVEAVDLETRVLADHPGVGRDRAPEVRLRPRVLVVGLAHLGRVVAGAEQLDPPTRQCCAQLAQLALVGRAELRYRLHSTLCTKSRSATSPSSLSEGVSSVSVTTRRSSSSSSRRRSIRACSCSRASSSRASCVP